MSAQYSIKCRRCGKIEWNVKPNSVQVYTSLCYECYPYDRVIAKTLKSKPAKKQEGQKKKRTAMADDVVRCSECITPLKAYQISRGFKLCRECYYDMMDREEEEREELTGDGVEDDWVTAFVFGEKQKASPKITVKKLSASYGKALKKRREENKAKLLAKKTAETRKAMMTMLSVKRVPLIIKLDWEE
jgi:hypothetical protein